MAAPTFVADYEVSSHTWADSTEPKTTSVTTAAGDVLVDFAGTAEAGTGYPGNTPTGGTPDWVQKLLDTQSSHCGVSAYTSEADVTAQTYTFSQDLTNAAVAWGFDILRFSGSDGIGATALNRLTDTLPTVNLTTLQANSAVAVAIFDWDALDGVSRVWDTVNSTTPTVGNGLELVYQRVVGVYTIYVAYYPDVGAAGLKTFGLSGISAPTPTIMAVEIKGTGGAPSPGSLASQVRFIAAGALAANATTAALACTGPACAVNDILIYAGMGKNNQVVSAPDGTWTKFVEINNTANQRVTLAWKRAVIGDIGGISYAFTKPVDDNLLNIGVISAWRGCRTNATPIDATTPTNSPNASSDTVTYATFDPTEFMAYVVAVGVYNDDLTTAGTISGTDPTLTNRWDLESATGTDGSCFGYSGPSTGVATGARSHSTTSTNDAVNIGVLFGLVSDAFPLPSDQVKRRHFSSHLTM